MNKKQEKRDIKVIAVLGIAIIAILYLTLIADTSITLWFNVTEEFALDSEYEQFAILLTFGYDALPTILQQVSIGAISVMLLEDGFSPIALAVVSIGGLMTGHAILYGIGMSLKKMHKGSIGNIAGNNHWLHKYHFLVYFALPFLGVLGDAGFLYSGHQRINPLKIIPFVLVADIIITVKWIVPVLAQLQIEGTFF